MARHWHSTSLAVGARPQPMSCLMLMGIVGALVVLIEIWQISHFHTSHDLLTGRLHVGRLVLRQA